MKCPLKDLLIILWYTVTAAIIFSLACKYRHTGFTCMPLMLCMLQDKQYSCHIHVSLSMSLILRSILERWKEDTGYWREQRREKESSGVEEQLCMSYLYCSMSVTQLIGPAIKRNKLSSFHLWCGHWLYWLTWGQLVPLQHCSICKWVQNSFTFSCCKTY